MYQEIIIGKDQYNVDNKKKVRNIHHPIMSMYQRIKIPSLTKNLQAIKKTVIIFESYEYEVN